MTDTLAPEDLATPEEFSSLLATLLDTREPAPYPHTDIATRGAQDDLDELGGPGDAPRTSREAAREGRRWIAVALFLGVGYCLKAIRSLFGVGALWPDASTAWEETEHKHRTSDPNAIPWGVPVWWWNSRYGHVAFSIGGGLCLTTDYTRPGYFCVARIADLGPWCGGELVGWSNDINGVVVWRPKKKAKPYHADAERLAIVEAALKRAQKANARREKIEDLKKWADRIRARVDKKD
jgi:hypothetical protein